MKGRVFVSIGLMKKFTYMFEEEVEEMEKINIYSVPNFCIPVTNFLPIQC